MINIILCGGAGTRLWPVSRRLFPKQFQQSFNGLSLYQHTLKRNQKLCTAYQVVGNMDCQPLCLDQSNALGIKTSYIIEPVGKNTAPAIALACFRLAPDDIVLVSPSDQIIIDDAAYHEAASKAKKFAKEGFIVTFGITPHAPETGYGYIEADGNDVLSFKEKPDRITAESYIADGLHYWNAGMFCFKASVYLQELKKYAPAIYETAERAHKKSQTINMLTMIDYNDMMDIPSDSIDYAVMEKSDLVKVVPCNCGWSDLGSFDSLYDCLPKDAQGNTADTSALHIDSYNNFVFSSNRKIVTIGMEDLVVVDTHDALLLMRRGHTQDVKKAVEALRISGHEALCETPVTTYFTWGHRQLIEENGESLIRRTTINPEQVFNFDKKHASGHWVVLSGRGVLKIRDEEIVLLANGAFYVAEDQNVQLINNETEHLVLIETCIKKKDAKNIKASINSKQRHHG